jgi:ATP-dependent DNA ligase
MPRHSPVEGRGRELFELMCMHDLEGIVAKRLAEASGRSLRAAYQLVQNHEKAKRLKG